MSAAEVVGQWIESNGYEDMGMDSAELLEALKAAGYAVVELPEPFPIEVTEIDMEPSGEPEWGGESDHRARMVIRFSDAVRPGRLFDRGSLAASLLAAEAQL